MERIMSDANIISMAITLFAIAAGSIFNNLRISDAALHNGQRFDDVNKRFDDVNKRFDDVNRRFDDVNKRFDDVNKRLDDMNTKLDRIADTLLTVISDHEQRLRALEHPSRSAVRYYKFSLQVKTGA